MFLDISFREPRLEDGMAVHRLVGRCSPLDPNSAYCNFLQCSHFSSTCIAAEQAGELVGFISAYRLPEMPETLFIWQVAVDGEVRGRGLAATMLRELLKRKVCESVSYLQTTITADNAPSWGLFRSFANRFGLPLTFDEWLENDRHFQGEHDSEQMVTIGPINLRELKL